MAWPAESNSIGPNALPPVVMVMPWLAAALVGEPVVSGAGDPPEGEGGVAAADGDLGPVASRVAGSALHPAMISATAANVTTDRRPESFDMSGKRVAKQSRARPPVDHVGTAAVLVTRFTGTRLFLH
jgi:hypothetical protein